MIQEILNSFPLKVFMDVYCILVIARYSARWEVDRGHNWQNIFVCLFNFSGHLDRFYYQFLLEFLGAKLFLDQQLFWVRNYLESKIIWVQQFSGVKIVGGQGCTDPVARTPTGASGILQVFDFEGSRGLEWSDKNYTYTKCIHFFKSR